MNRIVIRITLGAVMVAGVATSQLVARIPPAMSARPAAACRVWKVVPSPNRASTNGEFSGVAAVSPTDAWAVGSNGLNRILTEHWNGAKWSIVPSPTPGGSVDGELTSVTAVSSGDAWVAGYITTTRNPQRALIEHWNGRKWSVASLPATQKGVQTNLAGIVEVSPSDVWAVGHELGQPVGFSTLIEHWQGSNWTVVASPNASGNNQLDAVAAVGKDDVWAVGSSGDGTLIEHWNGTTWSIVSNPGPFGGELRAVAAISPNDVWAVGTVFEHWNGTAWSIVKGVHYDLISLVAVSATDVWAGGFRVAGSDTLHPVVERWNGAKWTTVTSPDPLGSDIQLKGMAAARGGGPWAVGSKFNTSGNESLVERWNGSHWRIVASPNPKGSENNLNSVAAGGVSDAWAVGSGDVNGLDQSLIEHWSGTKWSVAPSFRAHSGLSYLTGVSTVSSGDAWAVGYVDRFDGIIRPLIEHWNGSTWSSVAGASRKKSKKISQLFAVAAISGTDVWAVGLQGSSDQQEQPLIEHWNGAGWRVVAAQNPKGSSVSALEGVAAVSATDVWAVGSDDNGSLIEHWNGAKWSQLRAPNEGDSDQLSGVAATSSLNVWAVGSTIDPQSDGSRTVTERWNGAKWVLVRSLDPSNEAELKAVAATSTRNVYAVGDGFGPPGTLGINTVVAHWNGAGWNVERTPSVAGYSYLTGVAATSPNVVWSVGYRFVARTDIPLIERRVAC